MPEKPRYQVLVLSEDEALRERMRIVLRSQEISLEMAKDATELLEVRQKLRVGSVILLDGAVRAVESGQLLAALQEAGAAQRSAVGIIGAPSSDEEDEQESSAAMWSRRLRESIIDDILPRDTTRQQWPLRLSALRRIHLLRSELVHLRDSSLLQAERDRLTGTMNRDAILSILFRETDRVQRMNHGLCVILMDIDDFGHWNAELGIEACDDLLRRIAQRIQALLRSYDMLGRMGDDEFLIALPGCSNVNAVLLAERLRTDIFDVPFEVGGRSIRLSACFAIAESKGRSPVVVLREAEQTLQEARMRGPDHIRSANRNTRGWDAESLGGARVMSAEATRL
jgi:diguanylate cyclase (GGDEF)-like protein